MRNEAILNLVLPLTMLAVCLLASGLVAHPVPVGCASLALMAGGACLLVLARWPLIQARRFFEFGSGKLDARHRALYHAAYFAIWAGVVLGLLVALRAWAAGQAGS